MLPHISAEEDIPPIGRKMYINPNFHNQMASSLQFQGLANNSLLQSWDRPAIHINPQFLQRQQQYQLQQLQQEQQQQQQHVTYYQQTVAADLTPPPAKIISKASTCLVRKQITTPTVRTQPSIVCIQPPLVSLSKRKLIRQGASIVKPTIVRATSTVAPPAKRTKYKLVRAIPLTSSSSTPLVKKRRTLLHDFVARYALRRTNDAITGKKLR